MGRANYTVEQIIIKLREVELSCNQGKTIARSASDRVGRTDKLALAQVMRRYEHLR